MGKTVAQPFAQAFHTPFEIERLADERTYGKRNDNHGGAAAFERAALDAEHLLERAGKAYEQNAQSGCLEQGALHAIGDKAPTDEPCRASCEYERNVDDGSKSGHGRFSLVQDSSNGV